MPSSHDPAPPPTSAGWTASLTRVAAVAGALIAVGQSASSWIDGHFHADMEREKTRRELQLADLKERSALAESYLKLILAKDTPEDGRAILYSALGQLKDHPLQPWAQQRYDDYQRSQASLRKAFEDQAAAAALGPAANMSESTASYVADIQVLNVRIAAAMENPSQRDELQRQLVEKSRALALAAAAGNIERLGKAPSTATGPAATVLAADTARRVTALTERVDAAFLKPLFPASAAANIDANAPYLRAALQEFGVADSRLVAAIVATIAVEDPSFGPLEEAAGAAAKYESRFGNTDTGDGVKYRGRGFLALTGRANYQRIGEQLGLGTRLVDSPQDINSPEVASRVLVAWVMRPEAATARARLDYSDTAAVRRLLTGGATQLPKFDAVYRQALQGLTAAR
ncbi:hypothetical protein [Xylophilus sp. GOD-11R]|uniref:hypothetical protein n=1 Tax=Xylophilus sp. GOD-11R TaxID=3089814 RepID=UPI00298C8A8B|nr:hypothetical protein [Xylophilus sp. GOD-11R]WPB56818.1 hypothetical protein R9X41_22225 [Xylophilus sp. GOD-11R]